MICNSHVIVPFLHSECNNYQFIDFPFQPEDGEISILSGPGLSKDFNQMAYLHITPSLVQAILQLDDAAGASRDHDPGTRSADVLHFVLKYF